MAQKVDELQLQITSNASSAIQSLDELTSKLQSASDSAKSFVNSANSLKALANGLNKIAGVNFNSAISGLTRLSKIDLSNLKDKKVDITLSVSGADQAERLKYATQDAEKNVLKSASRISKAFGQKYNVDSEGISEMTVQVKELISALANENGGAANEAIGNIFNIITERGRMSLAELQGVKNAYLKEYNELKKIVVGTNNLSATEIESLFGQGFGANLKKGAESTDKNWAEIVDEHKDVFENLGASAASVGDQVKALADRLQELRTALEPQKITDDNILNGIGFDVNSLMESIDSTLQENIGKNMRESAGKIPLDLDIDQKRFEEQIQRAINHATDNKTYTAKPIQIKIDEQGLRQNVEHAFSLIDITKLPEYASNFERMSQAISQMNQSSANSGNINSFVNALRRLVSTDITKFDPAAFEKIVALTKDLASFGGVDKTLNRFISSLARLANAGDNARKTAYGLDALIPRLRSAVKSFIDIGSIDSSISQFVTSLAKLATAGSKVKDTATNLDDLTKAVLRFLRAMRNAPQISDNLAMTIQGLGNLAAAGQKTAKALDDIGSSGNGGGNSVLSGAFGNAARSATNGLKGILDISLRLGGQGASALGKFMQRLGLLSGASNSIDRTAITFGNLLRAILPFYGIRGIFDWAKEAVTVGSSLVEIENVIDTAFGSLKKGYQDISGYTYDWAKTTIDNFGVSELAAKQYAGRLMSMFNSSGFDVSEGMRNSAAKMTTDLIERAGDIASFYDMNVDEAMTKIQAGLAGMNRPLRSIGINMSVANLEAFALSKGINTSWKEMDQATQMALRYEYILNASQYAMGDFARTSQTYANQIRLLQLNFQSLSATIGQGLISAIAPAISWLNALIRRLITAANVFRSFMFTLFGKALGASKGVANEMAGYLDDSADAMGDLGSGAGGASDGLGSAGKAAKELKKQLTVLPFDELNQLAKDTESAGSGGSGGGGGGGGVGGLGGLDSLGLEDLSDVDIDSSPTIQAINRWAARIREAFQKHQWKNLGRIVAEGINAGFGYIYDVLDWNKIKPKVVDGFITPFQEAFNSFMLWTDWPLIGRTIGRGLNDITYTLRAWFTGFNWREYGGYFAEGMNGLLDEWDAEEFGRLIADKFKMAWDMFGGWVKKFDFAEFGRKMKEGVLGFLDEIDPKAAGETLAEFLNGISTAIHEFLSNGDVIDSLTSDFVEFVNSFLENLSDDDINQAMSDVKDSIGTALGKAIKGIDKDELKQKFIDLLTGLPWDGIGLALGVSVGAKLAGHLLGNAFKTKAAEILSGLTLGGGATGATAGATGAGAASSALGAAGLTVSQLSIIGAVSVGGIALGLWLKKQADESGLTKLFQLGDKDSKKKSVQSVGEGQSKNQQILNKQNMTGAGTYTSIQTVPQTPKPTASTQTVTTVMKGKTDPSFIELLLGKKELFKDPVATKTGKGKEDGSLKDLREKFHGIVNNTAAKTAEGRRTSEFNNTRSLFHGIVSNTAIKTAEGKRTSGFNTTRSYFHDVVSNWATKTADGWRTGAFKTAYSDYMDLHDKDVTVSVDVDIDTAVTEVVADIQGAAQQVVASFWTRTRRNAKGGLFTGATGFQVFGEAGMEAAIPLERKSTMKRIASAIVDSGGMATGSSSELADEIALRIAPIVMSAVTGNNERPINVNATLYTENNEVLARAVNQGNRSLDKRYNPVTQYSY